MPCDVASPVLLIVATDGNDDDHVALEVRSCVGVGDPLAAKVAVAVYCCVVPKAILVVSGGAMAMEATSAEVRLVDPVIPLKTAVIVAVPVVVPAVARPLLTLMSATPVLLEPQVTKEEMFCVTALARVPVALY